MGEGVGSFLALTNSSNNMPSFKLHWLMLLHHEDLSGSFIRICLSLWQIGHHQENTFKVVYSENHVRYIWDSPPKRDRDWEHMGMRHVKLLEVGYLRFQGNISMIYDIDKWLLWPFLFFILPDSYSRSFPSYGSDLLPILILVKLSFMNKVFDVVHQSTTTFNWVSDELVVLTLSHKVPHFFHGCRRFQLISSFLYAK